MTTYQKAKASLKSVSLEAKQAYTTDKPMIREVINNYTDVLCKSLRLSEHERNLLSNYACTLHPIQ